MLQHCPIDVTGFGGRIYPAVNGVDGTAYDSQNPRQAFVLMLNSTQSGISIFLVWPLYEIFDIYFAKVLTLNKSFITHNSYRLCGILAFSRYPSVSQRWHKG